MAYKVTDRCIGCGACSAQCPVEAIEAGSPAKINKDICIACGACAAQCPVEAIEQED